MTSKGFHSITPQLTQEEAIAFFENRKWEALDARTCALFQIQQERLCMPFDVFHKAVEETLGRPVFTHELALNTDGLLREMKGRENTPTFDQILNLIPPDKRVVVAVLPD